MDVIAECGNGIDHINDVASKVTRVAGSEAHTADAGDFSYRREQFREGLLPFRVAVAIYILPEQLNFGISLIGDATRLGEHGRRTAAALLPARVWDDTVGAEFVAALDDGDVAPVGVLARRELGFKCFVGLAVVEAGNSVLACLETREHLGKLAVGGGPGDKGHVRGALEDSLALLLSHTS